MAFCGSAFQAGGPHAQDRGLEAIAYAYAEMTRHALEKRVGGHFFQLNVSNALGTTMAQIAQGGPQQNNWFLGFNLSRKFS